MKNEYENLFWKPEIYLQIFEHMIEEVFVFDEYGYCIYINPAAERSEGFSMDQVRGKRLLEIYEVEREESPTYLALTTGKPVEDMVCVYDTRGRCKTKISSAYPIIKDRKFEGVFCIQRDYSQLAEMIDKNLELQTQLNQEKSKDKNREESPALIGESESFQYVLSLAQMAAESDSNVLLVGEDGSGKTTIARYIHEHSSRAQAPFLSVDCASVPEELVEHVLFGSMGQNGERRSKEGIWGKLNEGTLFLKNITHLPGSVQMRLIRMMEEHKDFRLICGSKRSSTDIVRKGMLHMDFFYSISVVQICIPALRERGDDIVLFAEHFQREFNQKFSKQVKGISPEVMSWFFIYSWPGNIRQFHSCIEAAMNYAEAGGEIVADDLPANIFYERQDEDTETEQTVFCKRKLYVETREKERTEIVKALEKTKGNVTQAARYLGISRQLLYYRMKKYQIE